ncbi:MAG: DUF6786 family protein, partial [Phycisphaerae bacterium]
MPSQTYADDLALLRQQVEVVELSGPGDARVAVVPAYQGRVMTSTLAGDTGASFGWLNEDFIISNDQSEQFNNYGGEDRFWLGPEAGQFGLWFCRGEPFDLDHWRTPPGFNSGPFEVASLAPDNAEMTTRFDVTNYSGTTFICDLLRNIAALDAAQFVQLPDKVSSVAFESTNTLTNAGDEPWRRETGLLSIWVVGQFKPLPRGKVVVPLAGKSEMPAEGITTDYFGELPADRCHIVDDHVLFTCDGKHRSKIGIAPSRAREVLGSYDADNGVLTVVWFNLPDSAEKLPYVNSLWKIQDDPYAGDVVNSYNDGPPAPGVEPMGPFYEIETSSPAAELKPGQSISHTHRTAHFAGEFEALNELAENILGVDLSE